MRGIASFPVAADLGLNAIEAKIQALAKLK